MYRVIKYFTDLKDNHHAYNVGDEFPRVGLKVTDARLEELSGATNIQGVPLIEKVESLNSATPVQQEEIPVEQEDSPVKNEDEKAEVEVNKSKRSKMK